MTTQQKADLENWKQDQSQPLPESLKNVLIEDCFEIIIEKGLSVNFGNSLRFEICGWYNDQKFLGFYISNHTDGDDLYFSEVAYERLNYHEKIIVIQTLLSRTPDGQAVMSFLDVRLDTRFYKWADKPTTLDHLLYREFTEALRIGKTFDEGLEIINLIYLQYV